MVNKTINLSELVYETNTISAQLGRSTNACIGKSENTNWSSCFPFSTHAFMLLPCSTSTFFDTFRKCAHTYFKPTECHANWCSLDYRKKMQKVIKRIPKIPFVELYADATVIFLNPAKCPPNLSLCLLKQSWSRDHKSNMQIDGKTWESRACNYSTTCKFVIIKA